MIELFAHTPHKIPNNDKNKEEKIPKKMIIDRLKISKAQNYKLTTH